MLTEQTGAEFDKQKVSASYLDAKKQKHVFNIINQTLNGLTDENHKNKYFAYLKAKGITIVSDIFERMDMDRKIIESLRKLQSMDGLSEEDYYKKKQALMRKLTKKATAFLYEKKPKKQDLTLREMASKKEKEEKLKRANFNKKGD